MNKKIFAIWIAAAVAVTAIVAGLGGYFAGKASGSDQLLKERETLRMFNRSVIENIVVEEGETIYAIEHLSPDSDTVCCAITYAGLLTKLGYNAEARITQEVSRETAYILREAGAETPPILENASEKKIFLVDHSEYAQAAEGMETATS